MFSCHIFFHQVISLVFFIFQVLILTLLLFILEAVLKRTFHIRQLNYISHQDSISFMDHLQWIFLICSSWINLDFINSIHLILFIWCILHFDYLSFMKSVMILGEMVKWWIDCLYNYCINSAIFWIQSCYDLKQQLEFNSIAFKPYLTYLPHSFLVTRIQH